MIKISPYARPEDGGAEKVEAWSADLIVGLHQVRLVDKAGGAFMCVYLGSSDSDRVDAGSGLLPLFLLFFFSFPFFSGAVLAEKGDACLAA
ncbi:hypothetical protein EL84_30540, partial [Paenibacillus sp. VT-400]|uniref:hypothetical protein n=1 Tax=Paenibacillus sp. VT-400 TaxID=1495853 RepID=UPI00064A70EF